MRLDPSQAMKANNVSVLLWQPITLTITINLYHLSYEFSALNGKEFMALSSIPLATTSAIFYLFKKFKPFFAYHFELKFSSILLSVEAT